MPRMSQSDHAEGSERVGGKVLICEQCGSEFTPDHRKKARQRFCSYKCSNDWWHANRIEYVFICKQCGKEYTKRRTDTSTFCSRECAFIWKHNESIIREQEEDKQKHSGICIVCGREFKRDHASTTICSRECNLKRNNEKYFAYAHKKKGSPIYLCRYCGKPFTAHYGDKRRRYCSDECDLRHNGRIGAHIRRARMVGNGPIEIVDHVVVFNRDGWVCGICGKKVNRDRIYPDPKSPSLDHIIPIANGGSHTYQNVQLAHLRCNIMKGAHGGKQTRLDI